jgi:hypothetical protein
VRDFDAGHGRGQKQQDENTADDLKSHHGSILLVAILEKQTPERRVRSMPAPVSLNGACAAAKAAFQTKTSAKMELMSTRGIGFMSSPSWLESQPMER